MALTKAAKPISVRSFLPSKVGGSIRENPVTAMTTAVNRLGATVEDIGKILVSSMQVSMPSAADDRAAQLKRDKREEARLEAKNIKKKDIIETSKMIKQLLTSSNKYMMEGQRVVSELEKANSDDIPPEFAKNMKNQLVALNSKQQHIHNRVEEIQEMLNEMYGLDEDDTF